MEKGLKKSFEITDAKISFVSLVDKAANLRQFLITKEEDGKANFTTYGKIIKADAETHFVTGIVYEPMTEDAHGNYMTADEITKAAYWFAKNGNKVDLQHSFVPLEKASVVESWIAKADFDIDGESVTAGTWLMTVEIEDPDVWTAIEKGEITGLSMGGIGIYSEEDTDLSNASKTATVQKGAVADTYNKRNKGTLFWNAFDALRINLCHYSGYEDADIYETDEAKIKEALTDFNNIITDLLTGEQPITKALVQARPADYIEKAGKRLSSKNKETLQGIYDTLGTFLASFNDPDPDDKKPTAKPPKQDDTAGDNGEGNTGTDSTTDGQQADDGDTNTNKTDPKKEDKTVTKAEAIKVVQDELANQQAASDTASTVAKATAAPAGDEQAVTADLIKSLVHEELMQQQAAEPAQEPQTLTKAEVQAIVKEAVAEYRKSRPNPSNLNGTADNIQKNAVKPHYLHGLL